MISTCLSTTDQGILSHKFIPPNAIPMIERRIVDNTIFGQLQITVPRIDRLISNADDEPSQPRNIVAGFVLDTSESMITGNKLTHAKNTIKNFMDVLLAERNGKTIEDQPFHSWIYVITFNSNAELVIPFQEITEETVPKINKYLDSIRAYGCTNYERAFQKQTEVIDDVILQLDQLHEDQQEPVHYHFMRFFETDGEITEGSRNIPKLYDMMRETATFVPASAFRLTFEDCVLGYGINVDLSSLKTLASPYPPAKVESSDYNCSLLKTILQPQDIGCTVGEILFKTILRYGVNVEVSVSSTTGKIEIFEYQTHQWGSSTKLHSLIHGEKKPLWIQYIPFEGAPPATIQVRIEYYNQFTGKSFSNTFDHCITTSMIPLLAAPEDPPESTQLFQKLSYLILGMIQIEIFKILREIEANRYDRDTIVHEAYKVIRMLNSMNAITYLSFPTLASKIQNLMTDAKVIIGLTTIHNLREQNLVLHARRICSAEQDMLNACSSVSRKYVEFEEDYEDVAKQIIQEAKAKAKANGANDPEEMDQEEFEQEDDVILSRIPTCVPHNSNPRHGRVAGSTIRTLCAKIALARIKKQDITPEQIYDQMRTQHRHYDAELDAPSQQPYDDDTFSSTPMDDEYTLRRMGMMRQMSSS
jgi:uncharacterized protein YegL